MDFLLNGNLNDFAAEFFIEEDFGILSERIRVIADIEASFASRCVADLSGCLKTVLQIDDRFLTGRDDRDIRYQTLHRIDQQRVVGAPKHQRVNPVHGQLIQIFLKNGGYDDILFFVSSVFDQRNQKRAATKVSRNNSC